MYFEPDQYKKIAWYAYGFGVFVLVFLHFAPGGEGQIAEVKNNVKRWLNLPVLGQIQPAEFIKTLFILGLATIGEFSSREV